MSPAASAATWACESSMNVNSTPSSGVVPPHHDSLRV
jgi:hypothetical protein